jgi:hypothetical protein
MSTVVLEFPATDGKSASATFNDATIQRRDADEGWLVLDSANRITPPEPPQAPPGA